VKPRLIVFTKAPVIGGAKSRLAAGIGKVPAWRVYRAMLARLTRRLRDPRWGLVLAVAPDRALRRRFPGAWPDNLLRMAQGGGDLGARQALVFSSRVTPPRPSPQGEGGGSKASALKQVVRRTRPYLPPPRGRAGVGGAPTLVIGSDAPQVTRADIAAALKALKTHDAVVGPAQDGGYWLLGLNAPAPAGLFHGVRWSHGQTLSDLEARMRALGLTRIAHLRTLRDVDEAGDLKAPKFH
jgi:hypothetical protein